MVQPKPTGEIAACWSRIVIHESKRKSEDQRRSCEQQDGVDSNNNKCQQVSSIKADAAPSARSLKLPSSPRKRKMMTMIKSFVGTLRESPLIGRSTSSSYHHHHSPAPIKPRTSNMIALSIKIFIPILVSLAIVKLNVINCDQAQQPTRQAAAAIGEPVENQAQHQQQVASLGNSSGSENSDKEQTNGRNQSDSSGLTGGGANFTSSPQTGAALADSRRRRWRRTGEDGDEEDHADGVEAQQVPARHHRNDLEPASFSTPLEDDGGKLVGSHVDALGKQVASEPPPSLAAAQHRRWPMTTTSARVAAATSGDQLDLAAAVSADSSGSNGSRGSDSSPVMESPQRRRQDSDSVESWQLLAASNPYYSAEQEGPSKQSTWWSSGERQPAALGADEGLSLDSGESLVGEHNYLQFGSFHQPEQGDFLRTDKVASVAPAHNVLMGSAALPKRAPSADLKLWNSMNQMHHNKSLSLDHSESDVRSTNVSLPDATSNLLSPSMSSPTATGSHHFRFDALVPILGPAIRSNKLQAHERENPFNGISVSATRAPNNVVEYMNSNGLGQSSHTVGTTFLVAPAASSPPAVITTSAPSRRPSANEPFESWGRRKPKGEGPSSGELARHRLDQTTTSPKPIGEGSDMSGGNEPLVDTSNSHMTTRTTTSRRPVFGEQNTMLTAHDPTSMAPALAAAAAASSTYEDIITWTPAAGPAAYRAPQQQQVLSLVNGNNSSPPSDSLPPATSGDASPHVESPFAAQQVKLQQLKMELQQQALAEKNGKLADKSYSNDYLADETEVRGQRLRAFKSYSDADGTTRRPSSGGQSSLNDFGAAQRQVHKHMEPKSTNDNDSGPGSDDDSDDDDSDDGNESPGTTEAPPSTTVRPKRRKVPTTLKSSDFGREFNQLGEEIDDDLREVPILGGKPTTSGKRKKTAAVREQQETARAQGPEKRPEEVSAPVVQDAQSGAVINRMPSTTSRPVVQREPVSVQAGVQTRRVEELGSQALKQQQPPQMIPNQPNWNQQNQQQMAGSSLIQMRPTSQLNGQQAPLVYPQNQMLQVHPMQYSPLLATSITNPNQRFSGPSYPSNHPAWSITAFPYQTPTTNAMNYFSLLQAKQQQQMHTPHFMQHQGIVQAQRPPLNVSSGAQVRASAGQQATSASNWPSATKLPPATLASNSNKTVPQNSVGTPTKSNQTMSALTKETADQSDQRNARGDSASRQHVATVYTGKPPLTINLRTAQGMLGPNPLFWEAAAREAAQVARLQQQRMFVKPGKMPVSNAHLPPRHRHLPPQMPHPLSMAASSLSHTNGHAYPTSFKIESASQLHHPFAGANDFAQLYQSPEYAASYLAPMSAFVPALEPSDGLGFMAAMPMSSFAAPPPAASQSSSASANSAPGSNGPNGDSQFLKKGQSAVISAAVPLATPASVHDPFGWPMGYGSDRAKSMLKVNHVAPPPAHLIPAKIAAAQSSALLYPTMIDPKQGSSTPLKEDPSTILNAGQLPSHQNNHNLIDEDEFRHWASPHSMQAQQSVVRPLVWPAPSANPNSVTPRPEANIVQVTLSTRPPAPAKRLRLWQRFRLFRSGPAGTLVSRNSSSPSSSEGAASSKAKQRRYKRGIVDSMHNFVSAITRPIQSKSPASHTTEARPTFELDTSDSNRLPMRSTTSYIPLVDSASGLPEDIESSILAQALLFNSQQQMQKSAANHQHRDNSQRMVEYPFTTESTLSSTQVPAFNDLISGASSTLYASHAQPASQDSATSSTSNKSPPQTKPAATQQHGVSTSESHVNSHNSEMLYLPMVEPTLEPPANMPGSFDNRQPSSRDRLLKMSKNLLKSSRKPLTKLMQMTTNLRPAQLNSSQQAVDNKLQQHFGNQVAGSQQSLSVAQRLNHMVSPSVMIGSGSHGSLENFDQFARPLRYWYQQHLSAAAANGEHNSNPKPLLPLAAHTSQHLSPYSLIVDSIRPTRPSIPLRSHLQQQMSKSLARAWNSSSPSFAALAAHHNQLDRTRRLVLPKRLLELHRSLTAARAGASSAQRSDIESHDSHSSETAQLYNRHKLSLQPFMRMNYHHPSSPNKLRPPTRLRPEKVASEELATSRSGEIVTPSPAQLLRRTSREFDNRVVTTHQNTNDSDKSSTSNTGNSNQGHSSSTSWPPAQKRSQLQQWPALRQTIRMLNGNNNNHFLGNQNQQIQQQLHNSFLNHQRPSMPFLGFGTKTAQHRELINSDHSFGFRGFQQERAVGNLSLGAGNFMGAGFPSEMYPSSSSQQPVDLTGGAMAEMAAAQAEVSSLEEAAGLNSLMAAGAEGHASPDELSAMEMPAGAGSETSGFEMPQMVDQVAEPKQQVDSTGSGADIDQRAVSSGNEYTAMNQQQQQQQQHQYQQQLLSQQQQQPTQMPPNQWPNQQNVMMASAMNAPLGMNPSLGANNGGLQRGPRLPKFIPSINSMASKFRQHLFQTFKLANPSRWPLLASASTSYPMKPFGQAQSQPSLMLPVNFRPPISMQPVPMQQTMQPPKQLQQQPNQQPQQQQQQKFNFQTTNQAGRQPMDHEALAASYYNFGNPTVDLMGNPKPTVGGMHFPGQQQQQQQQQPNGFMTMPGGAPSNKQHFPLPGQHPGSSNHPTQVHQQPQVQQQISSMGHQEVQSMQQQGTPLVNEEGQIVYTATHQVDPQQQLVHQHMTPADQQTLQEYAGNQHISTNSSSAHSGAEVQAGSEAYEQQLLMQQQQQQQPQQVQEGQIMINGTQVEYGHQQYVVPGQVEMTVEQQVSQQEAGVQQPHHTIITDMSGNLITSDGSYIQEQTVPGQMQPPQFQLHHHHLPHHHHQYIQQQQQHMTDMTTVTHHQQQQQHQEEVKEPQAGSEVAGYNVTAIMQQQAGNQVATEAGASEEQPPESDQQQQHQQAESQSPDSPVTNVQVQYDYGVLANGSSHLVSVPAGQTFAQQVQVTRQQGGRPKKVHNFEGPKRLKPIRARPVVSGKRQPVNINGDTAVTDNADYQIIKASDHEESHLRLVNGTIDRTQVFHLVPAGTKHDNTDSAGSQAEASDEQEEQQQIIVIPQQHQQQQQEPEQQVLVFGEQQQSATGEPGGHTVAGGDSSIVAYRENGTETQQVVRRPVNATSMASGKHSSMIVHYRPQTMHHQQQANQSQDGVVYEFKLASSNRNEVTSEHNSIRSKLGNNGEQQETAGSRHSARQHRPMTSGGRQRANQHDLSRIPVEPTNVTSGTHDSQDSLPSSSNSAHEQYIVLDQPGAQLWNASAQVSNHQDSPAVFVNVKPTTRVVQVPPPPPSPTLTKQEQQMHKQLHEQLRRHPLKSPKSSQSKVRLQQGGAKAQQAAQPQLSQILTVDRNGTVTTTLPVGVEQSGNYTAAASGRQTHQVARQTTSSGQPTASYRKQVSTTAQPVILIARDSFTRPPKAKIRWQGVGGGGQQHSPGVNGTAMVSNGANSTTYGESAKHSELTSLESSHNGGERAWISSGEHYLTLANDTSSSVVSAATPSTSSSNNSTLATILSNHKTATYANHKESSYPDEPVGKPNNFTRQHEDSASISAGQQDGEVTLASRVYSNFGVQSNGRAGGGGGGSKQQQQNERGRFQTFSRSQSQSSDRKTPAATTTPATTTTTTVSGQRRDSRTGSTSFRLSSHLSAGASDQQQQPQVSGTSQAPVLASPENGQLVNQPPTPPMLHSSHEQKGNGSSSGSSSMGEVRPTVFSDGEFKQKGNSSSSTSVVQQQSALASQPHSPTDLESPSFGGPAVSVNYTSSSSENQQTDAIGTSIAPSSSTASLDEDSGVRRHLFEADAQTGDQLGTVLVIGKQEDKTGDGSLHLTASDSTNATDSPAGADMIGLVMAEKHSKD